jgi:hypothetical protein
LQNSERLQTLSLKEILMGLEVMYGIGALLLGAAICYALLRNSRNPRNDRIGAAAAREQYRHPDTYEPEKFRAGLKPNPDGTVPKTDGEPGLR